MTVIKNRDVPGGKEFWDHVENVAANFQPPEIKSDSIGGRGMMTAEQLAEFFHESYERLAPQYGYETRKESAKPWAEVPEQNRKLMTAVCAEILTHAAAQLAEKDAKIAKLCGEFEAQRQARLAAEHLVALTLEEQAIIARLRMGKRLVTCNAVDRPHSFNLCNATEGHSLPEFLDEGQLAEKEREITRLTRERDDEREAIEKSATLLLPLVDTRDGSLVSLAENASAEIVSLRERLRQREAELEQRWIAVGEELPEFRVPVIVHGGVAELRIDGWWTYMESPKAKIQWNVTHWQPLPSPPKEQP